MKTYLSWLLSAAFAVSFSGAAFATMLEKPMLEKPTGPVLLSVSGSISKTNDGETAKFDRAMLEELDWRTIESYTRWTDGPTNFSGATLASVLEAVGAEGSKFRATALNDYAVEIPVSDAEEYDVLLALDMNGEPMKIRDKGPVWIVYPQTQEQLAKPDFDEEMIWQLMSIEIID